MKSDFRNNCTEIGEGSFLYLSCLDKENHVVLPNIYFSHLQDQSATDSCGCCQCDGETCLARWSQHRHPDDVGDFVIECILKEPACHIPVTHGQVCFGPPSTCYDMDYLEAFYSCIPGKTRRNIIIT